MYNFYLFSTALLCCLLPFEIKGQLDQSFDVIWTDQEEKEILTEDEHKVAFRDVVLEGRRRLFLFEDDQLELF